MTLVALVLIDRASLLVAPCGEGGGGYSDQKRANDDNCAIREGIIVAGIEWLSEKPPEIWTALATIAIAAFTLTLWLSGEKTTLLTKRTTHIARRQMLISAQQTEIQRQQHALERLQFFAMHRPRLHVRHVSIVDAAEKIGHPTLFWDHGSKVTGGLVVVNWGGSTATIVETRYRIFVSKTGLPPIAPYDTDYRSDLLFLGQVFRVGESCATPISDELSMLPPPEADLLQMRRFETGNWQLFVMGQIRYRDENGVERFMGFCRQRGDDGIFQRVNNEDYEYED